MLNEALALSKRGWKVFPVSVRGKTPFKDTHGYKDSSSDEAEIRELWKRWPQANVAIDCGGSGLFVLDIDGAEGEASLAGIAPPDWKPSVAVSSGRPDGGRHLYFKSNGIKYTNKAGILPGIDIKNAGGSVIGAGSVHKSGAIYNFVADGELTDIPEWLLPVLEPYRKRKAPKKASKAPKNDTTDVLSPNTTEAIAEGKRNMSLASIGGKLRHAGLTTQTILITLLDVNTRQCQPPLPEAEVESIASSVSQYDIGPQFFTRTDTGNADRLIFRHGKDIRFCFDFNKWLIWNGTHWKIDKQKLVLLRAQSTVNALMDAAGVVDVEDKEAVTEAKKDFSWAITSLSRPRLDAMIELAKPHTPINVEHLDADEMLLGVKNGYLDLTTGKLLEPERGRYVTKIAPVEYDASAEAPRWTQFLFEIFEDNVELIDFVQRAVGYSLTGDVREQCFFLLHGGGHNGKSTFIDVLLHLLGPYGMETATDTIMESRRDAGQATPELAALPGIRFLSAIETQEGKRLNESLVKALTGGDRISARKLYADFFEFYPQFKLWLACNYLPQIHGTDDAIWRRILKIPFNVKFAGAKDDKKLKAKLRRELPGILTWAIEGCLAWQKNGLEPPIAVVKATDEYKNAMDVIGDFVDECTAINPDWNETKTAVYRAYTQWCTENGEKAVTQRKFSQNLQDRTWREKRLHGGIRTWLGVVLKGKYAGGVVNGDAR